jgi:hypothetical protein
MMGRQSALLAGLILLTASAVCTAQDRDTKVRNDRKTFQENDNWIYNDLNKALAEAKAASKPVLAVIRCIP